MWRAQLFEPALSTFGSRGLALSTVAVKLAPCMRDFIIIGMIWSVVSAVAQFFTLRVSLPALLAPWGRGRGRGDMAVLRKLIGNFPIR
jgi:hypothetical protein